MATGIPKSVGKPCVVLNYKVNQHIACYKDNKDKNMITKKITLIATG